MARNDTLLLDGIIDDRVASSIPSDKRDEAFEYLAFQQILREFDLNHDELLAGIMDGRDDGGIDGFFVLVNGNPLTDVDSFFWPKHKAHLSVVIVTCKHHDTFRQAPLDNLAATLNELFDLSLDAQALKGAYSPQILRARAVLATAYRRLSPHLDGFAVRFVYASRGDKSSVGESIRKRAEQIRSIAHEFFGNINTVFDFIGAAELVSIYRRARTLTHDLQFSEALTFGNQYVLLTTLSIYNNFITDESGSLKRYMFDSNVRSFMGLNRTNEDIRDTLAANNTPDFWWLNNGVTILAGSATIVGKSVRVCEPQIVNGLQTSESIFRHFNNDGKDPQSRSLLVKLIVSDNAEVRDAIIRSTNNQTNVEVASLHATDKVQRDIEDYMRRNKLYYERRKNFYINHGHHPRDIITPLYLAAGCMGLVLKAPCSAATLKNKFMRDKAKYERVFSDAYPLPMWPNIAIILRRADDVIMTKRPEGVSKGERFLKSWRPILALISVARALGTYSFSAAELAALDVDIITETLIQETWTYIVATIDSKSLTRAARRREQVNSICMQAATRFGIAAWQAVHEQHIPSSTEIDPQLVDSVNAVLPPQPWKPGLCVRIARELNCRPEMVSKAIALLIHNGKWNRQKDGVVYGTDGTVIMRDPERITQT